MNKSYTLLDLNEVIFKTKLSRSGIYQKMNEKEFPNPVDLGKRRIAWIKQEIDDWIAKKVRERKI